MAGENEGAVEYLAENKGYNQTTDVEIMIEALLGVENMQMVIIKA
jgi:hypothetical protein